jgi:formylmethanofuran dehydrogenase subunit E
MPDIDFEGATIEWSWKCSSCDEYHMVPPEDVKAGGVITVSCNLSGEEYTLEFPK